MLGALTMVPLAVIEASYLFLVAQPEFDSPVQALLFASYLGLILMSLGAIVGALEGLVSLGISLLTSLLAGQRLAEPRWMALLYSTLALPGIALVSAQVFKGRRASLIPGKDLIALGLGLVLLGLFYLGLRLLIAGRDRFRQRRWGPHMSLVQGPIFLFGALLLYLADQRVLPRLYPWFHLTLAVGTVALAQLGLAALYLGFRPRRHGLGRLAEPGLATLLFVGSLAGGAFALDRIASSQTMRFMAYEHTVLLSKALALHRAMGLMPEQRTAEPPAQVELEPTPPTVLRSGPRRPGASLVLITVDALRAEQMGVYGQSRRTTPNLDAWARGAAVFEQAYCPIPHTSFSLASLMTGTYLASEHRVAPHRRYRTLPEVLRRYGFKTAAFFPPAVFYIDREAFTDFEKDRFGFEYVKFEYLDAQRRVDQALAFLDEQRGQRVFLWLHFFEAHEPYELHAGFDFGKRALDRYHSEVAYVDHHLGRFLSALARERPEAVVALTADHGEEFGEHGGHYHGNALYEPQVRVPLVIRVPGLDARRVGGSPVQTIDLPVTLLGLLDLPLPATMRGRDLGPWLVGEDPRRLLPVFAEIDQKRMAAHGSEKLICDFARDFCELYDLKTDPEERRNLVDRRPEAVHRLRRELDAWMASHVGSRTTEARQEDPLALLGRGQQGDLGAAPGLVRLLAGSLELRRRAARALLHLHSPSLKPEFLKASRDPDPEVSLVACIGAALHGDPECLGKLPVFLKRPDLPPSLRRSALMAQARAGQRQATRPLVELLSEEQDLYARLEIIKALGQLGDPAAAPALRRQLAPLRTRLYAIEALGLVRGVQALPELQQSLQNDRFVSWRRASAVALGRIGDRQAIPSLVRAVEHDLEYPVVADALTALATLGGLPADGALSRRPWRCNGAMCRLDLGVPCPRQGPVELLLLVRDNSTPDGSLAAPTLKDSPGSSQEVTVLCGEEEVAASVQDKTRALVLSIPAGRTGRLGLRTRAPAPDLEHAALRASPVN